MEKARAGKPARKCLLRKLLNVLVAGVFWLTLGLFSLVFLVVVLLQVPQVQRWLGTQLSELASNALGVQVEVGAVSLDPMLRVRLADVLCLDGEHDTLFFAKHLTTALRHLGPGGRSVAMETTRIADGGFYIYKYGHHGMNLTRLLDKFHKPKKGPKHRFVLDIPRIEVERFRFRFVDTSARRQQGRLAYSCMSIDVAKLKAKGFRQQSDSTRMEIVQLCARDWGGLEVQDFRGLLSISSTGLQMRQVSSRIRGSYLHLPKLALRYAHWKSLSSFIDSVHLEAEVDSSRFNLDDLSYFFPLPHAQNASLCLAGSLRGKVSDISLRHLRLWSADGLQLALDASLTGLPDLHNTMVHCAISRLQVPLAAVAHWSMAFLHKPLALPSALLRAEHVDYHGELTGFLDDFVAYGAVETALGRLKLDMALATPAKAPVRYEGAVSAVNFSLGQLLGNAQVGNLSASAKLKGSYAKRTGMRVQVQAQVDSFTLFGHSYSGITLHGFSTPKSYSGQLAVHDSLVSATFNGIVDFADTIPFLHFSLAVDKALVAQMHIPGCDSISNLAFHLRSSLQGNSLDNLSGALTFSNFHCQHARGSLRVPELRIQAQQDEAQRHINVESLLFRADLEANLPFKFALPNLASLLDYHLPLQAHGWLKDDPYAPLRANDSLRTPPPGSYRLTLETRQLDTLLYLFYPQLHVASGSRLDASYTPLEKSLHLAFLSHRLKFDSVELEDVDFNILGQDSTLETQLLAQRLSRAKLAILPLHLRATLGAGLGSLSLQAAMPDAADLKTNLECNFELRPGDSTQRPYLRLRPHDSWLALGDDRWEMNMPRINFDTLGVEVENFRLRHGLTTISVAGLASPSLHDTLQVDIEGLAFEELQPLLPKDLPLKGRLSLQARVGGAYRLAQLKTTGRVQDLRVRESLLGQLDFEASTSRNLDTIALSLVNTRLDGHQDIKLTGLYLTPSQALHGTLQVDSCDLRLLNYLTEEVVEARSGVLNGTLSVSGSLKAPRAKGLLRFTNAGIYVKDLGVVFRTSSTIRLDGQKILLNNFLVRDPEDHLLQLNGMVQLKNLPDAPLHLRVRANQFTLMNTPVKAGALYSGKLISSLELLAQGSVHKLDLQLNAKTESGTSLHFHLPTQSVAKTMNSLQFLSRNSGTAAIDSQPLKVANQNSNHSMDLGLTLTPDAQLEVVIDQRTGSSMNVRGQGDLRILMRPAPEPAQLFGNYTIQRGDFNYALEGLLSRKFAIENGSHISMAGDLKASTLDVTAIYTVRTSLANLLATSDASRYKSRVPVECQIHITGNLLAPMISFGLNVPGADAETQSLVATAINSEEKTMRQFASLLLLGMFMPDGSMASAQDKNAQPGGQSSLRGVNVSNMLLSSLSDLVFGQLNNWLAQMGSPAMIGLGLNYQRADGNLEKNQDEAEVSFSLQWLEAGLNIDANWDVNKNTTSSAVAGNISVTKNSSFIDNLQYKAFARSNDDLVFSDQNPYTAGIGLVYGTSFDTLEELLNRLRRFFQHKAKEGLRAEEPASVRTTPEEQPVP